MDEKRRICRENNRLRYIAQIKNALNSFLVLILFLFVKIRSTYTDIG